MSYVPGGLYGSSPGFGFDAGGSSFGTPLYAGAASPSRSPLFWLGVVGVLVLVGVLAFLLYASTTAPTTEIFIHPGGGELGTQTGSGVGRNWTGNIDFDKEVVRFFRLRAGHSIVGAWYGNGVSKVGDADGVPRSIDVTEAVRAWLPGSSSTDMVYQISSGDVYRRLNLAQNACSSGNTRVHGKVNPLIIVTQGGSVNPLTPRVAMTDATEREVPTGGAHFPEVETKEIDVDGERRYMIPECYTKFVETGSQNLDDAYASYIDEVKYAVPPYGVQSIEAVYSQQANGYGATIPRVAVNSAAVRKYFLSERATGSHTASRIDMYLAFARDAYFTWARNAQHYDISSKTTPSDDARACYEACYGDTDCRAWEWAPGSEGAQGQCNLLGSTANHIDYPDISATVESSGESSKKELTKIDGNFVHPIVVGMLVLNGNVVQGEITTVTAVGGSGSEGIATLTLAEGASLVDGDHSSLKFRLPASAAPDFDRLDMLNSGGYSAAYMPEPDGTPLESS